MMQFTVQLASDLHLEWPGAYDRLSRQSTTAAVPVDALASDAAAATPTTLPISSSPSSGQGEDESECFEVVLYEADIADDEVDIPVVSEYFLLAGDIGNPFKDHYREYLTTLSHKYRHVFVVSGNHEYYGNEYYSTNEKIEEVCSVFPNVHFLNRKMVCVDDRLVVLGCTLWSNIPSQEAIDALVKANFGDYALRPGLWIRRVRGDIVGRGHLRPRDTNELHAGDVEFIRESLTRLRSDPELANRKVIVLTHHAPLNRGVSSPEHEIPGRLINHAFATDLRELIVEFADVLDVWAFGHTHFSSRQLIPVEIEGSEELKEVVVTSNQLGYFMDDQECGFDPSFTIPLLETHSEED